MGVAIAGRRARDARALEAAHEEINKRLERQPTVLGLAAVGVATGVRGKLEFRHPSRGMGPTSRGSLIVRGPARVTVRGVRELSTWARGACSQARCRGTLGGQREREPAKGSWRACSARGGRVALATGRVVLVVEKRVRVDKWAVVTRARGAVKEGRRGEAMCERPLVVC
jgi:hypothetical protein